MSEKRPAYLLWQYDNRDFSMRFDAVLSETHTHNANITEHPVEKGASIVDHIRVQPSEISLDVLISNHPITPEHTDLFLPARGSVDALKLKVPKKTSEEYPSPGAIFRAIGGLFSSEKETPQVNALQFKEEFDAAGNAYADLKTLQEAGILVTVVSPVWFFENMLISSISVPRDPTTADCLKVNLTLKQIFVVNVATTSEPLPVKPKNKNSKDLGKKPGTDQKSAEDSKKTSSVMKSIVSTLLK